MEVDLTSIMAQDCPDDNIAWDEPEPKLEAIRPAEPAPAPAPEPEPDASEKFGQERRRMILFIQMYLNEIPHKLTKYKNINLEKLSNKELEKLREEIEYVVGAGQNVKFGVMATIRGIQMFEEVVTGATKNRVNIRGLANSLCDQDSIDDIKCILIKHMDKIQMEPEYRLGLRIIANAGVIYTNNALGVSVAQPSQPSIPETPSKFADL